MAQINNLSVPDQNTLLIETLRQVRKEIHCMTCCDELNEALELIEKVIGP